ANVMSFLAPEFITLLVARFVIGISIDGFWALAAGIAVRIVPEPSVGRATSLAFGGATAANVLGVPARTLIGGHTDWRIAVPDRVNVQSCLAPEVITLLVARFVCGVSIGGIWALAAGIAVRIVPEPSVGRATSLAFGGATAANVLGLPAGTLIGGLTDWRIAF